MIFLKKTYIMPIVYVKVADLCTCLVCRYGLYLDETGTLSRGARPRGQRSRRSPINKFMLIPSSPPLNPNSAIAYLSKSA